MKKLILLLAVLAVAVMFVACGADSPTAPARPTSSTAVSPAPAAPTAADTTTPEPAAAPEDPCEGDASCGKGVTARFLEDLSLEVTSTNTGHDNTGVVCATDGFQGPNLPATPYPWHVKAKSTSVTPFPQEQIAAAIEWGPRECERTINVQMDAFRGETCEGHNLAVVWPQDNPVTFYREPGEWEWGPEARTLEEDWSECMSRQAIEDMGMEIDADLLESSTCASGVSASCVPQCFRYRKVTVQKIATRLCSEDTQVKTRSFVEYERCKCPCEDTGVWTLENTGRDTETFRVFIFGSFQPEFEVRLAPGEQHTFYGYEGNTLTAWVGLRHIDTTESYTCGPQVGDVSAATWNRPRGTLSYHCECIIPGQEPR